MGPKNSFGLGFPSRVGATHGSFVIGDVPIRQLRVQSAPCLASYAKLLKLSLISSTPCFPAWSELYEDTVYTGGGNATLLAPYTRYSSDTAVGPMVGRFATYPAGGFVVDVTAANASRTTAALAAAGWLDVRTRLVSASLVLYSPDADLVGIVDVIFEVRPARRRWFRGCGAARTHFILSAREVAGMSRR